MRPMSTHVRAYNSKTTSDYDRTLPPKIRCTFTQWTLATVNNFQFYFSYSRLLERFELSVSAAAANVFI